MPPERGLAIILKGWKFENPCSASATAVGVHLATAIDVCEFDVYVLLVTLFASPALVTLVTQTCHTTLVTQTCHTTHNFGHANCQPKVWSCKQSERDKTSSLLSSPRARNATGVAAVARGRCRARGLASAKHQCDRVSKDFIVLIKGLSHMGCSFCSFCYCGEFYVHFGGVGVFFCLFSVRRA